MLFLVHFIMGGDVCNKVCFMGIQEGDPPNATTPPINKALLRETND